MGLKISTLFSIRPTIALLMIAAFVLVTGCGAGDEAIDIAGSTTVQPLAEKLAGAYMKIHPETQVKVIGGGSSTGIRSVANGIVDIGTSSRELMENETAVLDEYPIALDGIAIIVHPSLEITSLTIGQVAAIFSGNVTNWHEVNGPDLDIDVVTREAGSGTRDTFEEKVMNFVPITDTALQQPSNGAVRSVVAGLKSSVGYISIPYIDASVKGVELDGLYPTVDSVKNGHWKLMRPLLMLTRGPAKGKAKDFIDFCLTPEAQEIVSSEGYARID
jgi:phosphate transport system substrate-binding protein